MAFTGDFTIVFYGQEPFDKNGESWVRYRYGIYLPRRRPVKLEAIFIKRRKVGSTLAGLFFMTKRKHKYEALYGGKQNGVPTWCFELSADVIPPSWVSLVSALPATERTYQSNFAESTL